MSGTTVARKRRTPEERRKEIVEAAITLFARQGFERTTTREIAAAAGISEGTIYKYFASKQEILLAFIRPQVLPSIPEIFREREGVTDAQLIREFIEDRFAVWERNRDLMRVIFGESLFNPMLAEGMHNMLLHAMQTIEGYIARRVEQGAFRRVNPKVASRALFCHLLVYFLKWDVLAPAGEEKIPGGQLFDQLTDLFLFGVQRTDGDMSGGLR